MILAREHLSAWALAMDQGCRSAEVPAGVRFVGREGGQLAVELKRDLSDADEAALVRWLLRGRWPAGARFRPGSEAPRKGIQVSAHTATGP